MYIDSAAVVRHKKSRATVSATFCQLTSATPHPSVFIHSSLPHSCMLALESRFPSTDSMAPSHSLPLTTLFAKVKQASAAEPRRAAQEHKLTKEPARSGRRSRHGSGLSIGGSLIM